MNDYPKKIIEVALPLDEINAACKADKARNIGTLRNLHKWFAPMPLPAWRALLYAALIDDPEDDEKRAYHLDVIKRLVANGADLPDENTLREARANLASQFPDGVPPVMDPFCGGGSTLVEAQRLGLPTEGSDLNPVPVLITRTLTELLPKVYGHAPLHPESLQTVAEVGPSRKRGTPRDPGQMSMGDASDLKAFRGYDGLASDVIHYAEQIRARAWEQLATYYPSQPAESPIAWLWARTAKCSNPACGIESVLTTSWWLSKKPNERAWIEPRVADRRIELDVVSGQATGEAPASPKAGRGASFNCLACGQVIEEREVIRQGVQSGLGLRLVAVAAQVDGERIYRSPSANDLAALTAVVVPEDVPEISLGPVQRYVSPPRFGLMTQASLYTPRQLLSLCVFADLVASLRSTLLQDGASDPWADAIQTILGLAVGKLAQVNSSQAMIEVCEGPTRFHSGFGRNDLPMTWDFFESNVFNDAGPNWNRVVATLLTAIGLVPHGVSGSASRQDARTARLSEPGLVATDPPYFDAIGYADLSDYFYLWHRRALKGVHPDLYATLAAPKQGELTAVPSHHGNDADAARRYFIDGFTDTFESLQSSLLNGLPMIVVYASKEQKSGSGEETRWSAILTAIINANLEITGTWPIHGTGSRRMIGMGTNAVATYVAMVCRPRKGSAIACTLTDFNRALRKELKPAVERLQAAGILPVDLAQAAMGPGMQVYSRYTAVLDQGGNAIPVEQALRLINQALTEVLDEQEGDLDADSRFAVTLWEAHHWGDVPFGEADQVARPQGISVDDVVRAKVAAFPRAGFVRLLGQGDSNRDWSPKGDARPTAWEAVHHLADRLIDGGGVSEAGALMADLGTWRDQAQALVYRLHAIAARRGWTEDQERYNALIGSWSDLLAEAGRVHDNGDGLF